MSGGKNGRFYRLTLGSLKFFTAFVMLLIVAYMCGFDVITSFSSVSGIAILFGLGVTTYLSEEE